MIEPQDAPPGDIAFSNRNPRVSWAVHFQRLKLRAARYWWIVALTIMAGLIIQGHRALHLPQQYISTSRMIVNGRLDIPESDMYSEEQANFYGTQVALMKSRQTIVQSIERVSAIHPEVPVDNDATIDAFQEPRTTIFNLNVTSVNAQYAKLLLDAVMDTYLANKRGRREQLIDEEVSAFTQKIANLEAEIRSDEQQLLDFQKANDVVFIEQQSAATADYLLGLNNELAELKRQQGLLLLENKDSSGSDMPIVAPGAATQPPGAPPAATPQGQAQPGDNNAAGGISAAGSSTNAPPAAPGGVADATGADINGGITAEEDNIEKLKIQRDQFAQYLKDKHPKMVALNEMIAEEEKFLDDLKSRYAEARDLHRADIDIRIKNLEQEIDVWNKKSIDLSDRLATYQQIKSKIAREQTLYNQLASSIQSVDFNKSLDPDNIVILESASDASKVKPNLAGMMLTGLLAGLLVGILIALLVNRLDDRIDSPLEFAEHIPYPLIGQVPLVPLEKKTKRAPLLTETDERQALLESYRNIRSAILFRSSDFSKPRSLLVSSTAPGAGKSTFAANLGIVFAYAGARVLLVDADMRRGVLHTLFDVNVSPGLSEYLQEQTSWRDAVQSTNLQNLDVITRGKIPQQAGDLLLGPLTDALLEQSVLEYDLVLWDSAPLFAADDAANLCGKVDGILFLARVRHSTVGSVREALEALTQRNARIFGVILNAVQPNQPGYYDRYKYKEYYAPVPQ